MNEMLNSGFELMLTGMVIVFVFLAMLVVLVNIMTAVIQRFFPETVVAPTLPVTASTSHTDAGIIAAISAAVYQYRNKNKQDS